DEHSGDQDKGGEHVAAETPRLVLASQRHLTRKGRDKRGAHRAFGEQIADKIRDSDGDDEGVHLVAGAEDCGENLIAYEPQDAAGERRRGGERRPARGPFGAPSYA